MLCLTRKIGERIVLDGNIVVTVLEISRGHVRLGLSAPRQVSIEREEHRHATERLRATDSALLN